MATVELAVSFKVLNVRERGVLSGALADNTARAANRVAFQAAIDEAASEGYQLWVPPGEYHIHGAALIIDESGFSWKGTLQSTIIQHSLALPVVHIGPPLATMGGSIDTIVMDGAYLKYIGTGTAGANALECSGLWMSSIVNIDIGDTSSTFASRTSVPYTGLYFDPSGNVVPQFSNTFKNIRIKHFVYRGIDMSHDLGVSASTGSTFENIYISGGSSDGQADLGTAPTDGGCGAFFQMQSQLTLTQFNVEWIRVNAAIHFDVCNQVEITAMNLEGVWLKRFYSTNLGFIQAAYSTIKLNSGSVYDCSAEAAHLSIASVFMLGEECSVTIDNTRVDDNTIEVPFSVIRHQTFGGDQKVNVALRGLKLNGTHGLTRIDDFSFSTGNEGPLYSTVGPFGSTSPVTLSNANVTHYTYNGFGVLRMSPSGGNKTITLSDEVSATDTCVIPRGTRRRVHCVTGAGSSLVVANHDAATLTTLAAGASGEFVFDGTNWVVV